MILITSFGEFLLYFIVIFLILFSYKKKVVAGLFFGCPSSAAESIFSGSKILRQAVQVLWEN